MTTHDVMLTRCCPRDDHMAGRPTRPDATRSPRAVVTRARLCASNGGGTRAFDRWRRRADQAWLPQVPERPRGCRLGTPPAAGTAPWLAAPPRRGGADREGLACIQPRRDGRSPHPIGPNGQRQHRWLVGGQRGVVWHPWGVIGAWDGATAHVQDAPVHPRLAQGVETLRVLTDPGCQAQSGAPVNMQGGHRGTWHGWMRVETRFARLTPVVHGKTGRPRVGASVPARGAWTRAACNLLAPGGRESDDHHCRQLSIADFSL
jgi:hypothetical protein